MHDMTWLLKQPMTARQIIFLERFLGEFHRLAKKLLEQVEKKT